jgi:hypothetical protein
MRSLGWVTMSRDVTMNGKIASWRTGRDEALAEYWFGSKSPERSFGEERALLHLDVTGPPPDE